MNARYLSEEERARAALAAIPAEDYTTWVDMAFALKQGFGEAGFGIWDEWSRSAHNYNERAARVTWRSAGESGGKKLASLFWLAQQHGFDVRGSRAAMDPAERARMAPVRPAADRADLEARARARQAAVAREALSIWQWARPVAPGHPYLGRKRVRAVPTLRELEAEELHALLGYAPRSAEEVLTGRVLVVPVRIGDALSTLELIDAQGRKSALAGGAKSGGYWAVEPDGFREGAATPILVAEGVATALAVWEATGWFSIAALSSGNLRSVAAMWRGRYPEAEMLVLADLGPGYEHARQAALGTSSVLAEPRFASQATIGGEVPTDFDDMAVLSGSHAVGEVLRESLYGVVARHVTGVEAEGQAVAADGSDGSKEDQTMSNVKEKLVGEGEVAGRRRAARRRGSGQEVPAPAPQESQTAGPTTAPAGAAQGQSQPEEPDRREADPPKQDPPAARAAGAPARRQAGEPLYGLDDVPGEIKALAQHRFGAQIRMAVPRENGGPYRGEVFNTEHYLIQEVSARSVVFHAKSNMEFVSDRLRWMDENQRLNGAEVQVGYDGNHGKVYPWDRSRDLLERTVASLKKSAREVGFGGDLDATLDQLQGVTWTRVREARAAALAKSKERAGREPGEGQER
ncbi:MAG: PriCT-2 domain-containing protein [Paraburkholderia sp.]|jgi:putative DNA primase/helicase|uniref:PriCT-2 domain-containing protein n=1 Tax=unclassified Paraburkholderia TaxID=2615204 RepID=UPI0028649C77|nr:PriCT-2 domain-containing protein [Paraburkholderia sp. USG1]MDR8394850.1 PriCT-2 domain-containing protein [Paraburkholderia sp. USG1]